VIDLGFIPLLTQVLDHELKHRPEDNETIFASDEKSAKFRKELENEKVDDHQEQRDQYTDGGAVTFKKDESATAAATTESQETKEEDEEDELPPEPTDDSSRIVRSILLILWQIVNTCTLFP